MSTQNEDLIREAYEAYARGDLATMLQPSIRTWSGSTSIPASRTRSRRSATVATNSRRPWHARRSGG